MKVSKRVAVVISLAIVAILVGVSGGPASAAPVAERVAAASVFVVTIDSDRTARINITAGSYSGSTYEAVTRYPSKCVVKILDRNGHRVLFNGKITTERQSVSIKDAKVKKGRIDIDARAYCAKKTVTVRDDGDPYRVVFGSVTSRVEGIDRFGGYGFSYFA